MNTKLLNYLRKKPEPYEKATIKFWDDEHISKGMLEAHLNPDFEAATRKLDFVKRSVDFISRVCSPLGDKKLLDIGCGPGIYAELFDSKGFRVSGMDISPRSIEYAKESALKKGLKIDYQCENYLNLNNDSEYDIITLIYCDFGVLNPEERKLLLSKVYKALKPNGLFIVDVWTPAMYENRKEDTSWSYQESGFWSSKPHACLESFYRYGDRNTFADQYVIIEDEDVRCYNIWEHAFTPRELSSDLKASGFGRIDLYENVAGDEYKDNSSSICAVAHKEGPVQ